MDNLKVRILVRTLPMHNRCKMRIDIAIYVIGSICCGDLAVITVLWMEVWRS